MPLDNFLYTLEKSSTPPETIVVRSDVWRRLREALSDMKVSEWLKIGVPDAYSSDERKATRFCENARSGGVYSYYTAIGGERQPFFFKTHLERDRDSNIPTGLWVHKVRMEDR